MKKLYSLTEEQRKILGINGKKFVLEYLDYEMIASKLEKVVLGCKGDEK